jgi:hypothetical protein
MGHVQPSGRLLVVNQKKQKNFVIPGRAGFVATGLSEPAFFAPLFSKKRLPSYFKLNL